VQKDCAFMNFVYLWSKTQQHAALESFTTSEKQEASSSYMMQCTAESQVSRVQIQFISAEYQPEVLLIHFGINLELPVAHLKLGALRHAPGVLHFAFGHNLAFLWHQIRALSAAHGRDAAQQIAGREREGEGMTSLNKVQVLPSLTSSVPSI